MAPRIVDVLVPVALDHAYSYRAPEELELSVGDLVAVPLGPREALGVVWADNVPVQARPAQPPQGRRGEARLPAAARGAAQIRRLGRELHAQPARHGAAHGLAHGRARSRARARRGAARRSAAAAHDAGAPPRARCARRWPAAHQVRSREGCRRFDRRDRRPGGRRHARGRRAAARAGRAPARSRLPHARADRLAAHGRRHFARRGASRAASWSTCSTASPARARPRSISRRSPRRSGSGRQSLVLLPEIALTAQFLDRFAAALRHASGRMAFGARRAQARAHLERGRGRRSECRGRRALGAVSPLRRPRPDRGR